MERFLKAQSVQFVRHLRRFLRFEWDLHLIALKYLQFCQWLLRIEEFEPLILRLFSDEHVKLGVLESPDVDFLINLLVHRLQLEAKVGGAFPFYKAIAVVVYLRLDLQSDTWSCFLGGVRESCEVVFTHFVLVPPE